MSLLTERYFFSLNREKGLFNSIPRNIAVKYFLVYELIENELRKYSAYRSSTEFYGVYLRYLNKAKPEFHEVILGEQPQKCRFDIDLTQDRCPPSLSLEEFGNNILERIVMSMAEIITRYGFELDIARNLALCTSHSSTKFSAHLILADYYHMNHLEALTFFHQVINNDHVLKVCMKNGIIDQSIFSTNHSMRLVGSYKSGVRVKKMRDSIWIQDQEIEFEYPEYHDQGLMRFRRTCITDTIGCKYLNVIVPIKEKSSLNELILPPNYEDELLKFLDSYENGVNYEIRDVKNNGLIDLRRTNPSMCKICKRIHDKIDPFVMIFPDGSIYYYCRQSRNDDNSHGRLKIGQFSEVKAVPNSQEQSTPLEKKPSPKEPSPEKSVVATKTRADNSSYEGCDYDLLKHMSKHSFSEQPKLNTKMRNQYMNKCFICDSSEHLTKNCMVSTVKKCTRCGREGHLKENCISLSHHDGRPMYTCTRCGRNNHTVDKCKAYKHYDGTVLTS